MDKMMQMMKAKGVTREMMMAMTTKGMVPEVVAMFEEGGVDAQTIQMLQMKAGKGKGGKGKGSAPGGPSPSTSDPKAMQAMLAQRKGGKGKGAGGKAGGKAGGADMMQMMKAKGVTREMMMAMTTKGMVPEVVAMFEEGGVDAQTIQMLQMKAGKGKGGKAGAGAGTAPSGTPPTEQLQEIMKLMKEAGLSKEAGKGMLMMMQKQGMSAETMIGKLKDKIAATKAELTKAANLSSGGAKAPRDSMQGNAVLQAAADEELPARKGNGAADITGHPELQPVTVNPTAIQLHARMVAGAAGAGGSAGSGEEGTETLLALLEQLKPEEDPESKIKTVWGLKEGALDALAGEDAGGAEAARGSEGVRARMKLCMLIAGLPSFDASVTLTTVYELRGKWADDLAEAQKSLIDQLVQGFAGNDGMKVMLNGTGEAAGGELLPLAVSLVCALLQARGSAVKPGCVALADMDDESLEHSESYVYSEDAWEQIGDELQLISILLVPIRERWASLEPSMGETLRSIVPRMLQLLNDQDMRVRQAMDAELYSLWTAALLRKNRHCARAVYATLFFGLYEFAYTKFDQYFECQWCGRAVNGMLKLLGTIVKGSTADGSSNNEEDEGRVNILDGPSTRAAAERRKVVDLLATLHAFPVILLTQYRTELKSCVRESMHMLQRLKQTHPSLGADVIAPPCPMSPKRSRSSSGRDSFGFSPDSPQATSSPRAPQGITSGDGGAHLMIEALLLRWPMSSAGKFVDKQCAFLLEV
jgi:hypothetical protein